MYIKMLVEKDHERREKGPKVIRDIKEAGREVTMGNLGYDLDILQVGVDLEIDVDTREADHEVVIRCLKRVH